MTSSPVTDITLLTLITEHLISGEDPRRGAGPAPGWPDITTNNAPSQPSHVSSQHCFHKIFIKWEMLMGSNHWETSSTSQIYRMMVSPLSRSVFTEYINSSGSEHEKNILSEVVSLGIFLHHNYLTKACRYPPTLAQLLAGPSILTES